MLIVSALNSIHVHYCHPRRFVIQYVACSTQAVSQAGALLYVPVALVNYLGTVMPLMVPKIALRIICGNFCRRGWSPGPCMASTDGSHATAIQAILGECHEGTE